jgi:hypothetical protein
VGTTRIQTRTEAHYSSIAPGTLCHSKVCASTHVLIAAFPRSAEAKRGGGRKLDAQAGLSARMQLQ